MSPLLQLLDETHVDDMSSMNPQKLGRVEPTFELRQRVIEQIALGLGVGLGVLVSSLEVDDIVEVDEAYRVPDGTRRYLPDRDVGAPGSVLGDCARLQRSMVLLCETRAGGG
jgi:hypothetical protein